jgi:hypothetical protein
MTHRGKTMMQSGMETIDKWAINEILNSNHEIRNKYEYLNSKPETRKPKLETRNAKL